MLKHLCLGIVNAINSPTVPLTMTGETDLKQLIHSMQPILQDEIYVFCHQPVAQIVKYDDWQVIASFVEEEGRTLVLPQKVADELPFNYTGTFRCISLQVHSSLQAVGLTAAVASELARFEISANVIAACFHDHIFVPEVRAEEAVRRLTALSQRS